MKLWFVHSIGTTEGNPVNYSFAATREVIQGLDLLAIHAFTKKKYAVEHAERLNASSMLWFPVWEVIGKEIK